MKPGRYGDRQHVFKWARIILAQQGSWTCLKQNTIPYQHSAFCLVLPRSASAFFFNGWHSVTLVWRYMFPLFNYSARRFLKSYIEMPNQRDGGEMRIFRVAGFNCKRRPAHPVASCPIAAPFASHLQHKTRLRPP